MTDSFKNLWDSGTGTTADRLALAQAELAPLGIQLFQTFRPLDREENEDNPDIAGVRQYAAQCVYFLRWFEDYNLSFASELTPEQVETLQAVPGVRTPVPLWSINTPAALAAFVAKLDELFGEPRAELDLSAHGRRQIDQAMSGWHHSKRDDLHSLNVPTISGVCTERQLDFGVLQFNEHTVLVGRWLDSRLSQNPEFGEYMISFPEEPTASLAEALSAIDDVNREPALVRYKVITREALVVVLAALQAAFGNWRKEIDLSLAAYEHILAAADNWSDFVSEQFAERLLPAS